MWICMLKSYKSNELVKFTSKIAWKQIFKTFLTIVQEFLDVRIIDNTSFSEESYFPLKY